MGCKPGVIKLVGNSHYNGIGESNRAEFFQLDRFEEPNRANKNADDGRPHQHEPDPQKRAIPLNVSIPNFFQGKDPNHGREYRSDPPSQSAMNRTFGGWAGIQR